VYVLLPTDGTILVAYNDSGRHLKSTPGCDKTDILSHQKRYSLIEAKTIVPHTDVVNNFETHNFETPIWK
jgi:hypothetical protein